MHDLTSFDRENVERFARDYEAVFYEGDFRRMASFYAEDAKLMASEMETIVGRRAIEDFWRSACERGKKAAIERSIRVEHVDTAGELGWMETTVRLRIGGTPTLICIRGVTVWKRQPDGAWRMTVDISCEAPPAGRAHALPYVESK
jgi:ketosteroid isomerase-like protein